VSVEVGLFFESGGPSVIATRVHWFEASVGMDVPTCFRTACTRDEAYASIDDLNKRPKRKKNIG
jgi:hypothetical protein